MIDNYLKSVAMDLMVSHPEFMREIRLSDLEINLLKTISVSSSGITAKSLCEILDISIQSSSSKLAKLHRKGYLTRQQCADESGGIFYLYRINRRITVPG